MIFIYGDEPYLIQEAIANATNVSKAQNIEVVHFGPEDSLTTIFIELGTVAMFATKKLLIIRNHEALAVETQAKLLLRELLLIDQSVDVIIAWEEKTYPRTSLTAWLIAHAETHPLNKIEAKQLMNYIKKMVETQGGSISNGAALQLASRLPNNLRIVMNEINKLLAEQNSITELQVKTSIGEYLKDEAFALTNALVSKDAYAIVSAYRNQKLNLVEPTTIIGQIGSLLSLCLNVASLRSQGYTNQDISDRLKIHLFRVQKAAAMTSGMTLEKIKDLSQALAKLDQNIKQGRVDAAIGLDYFVLTTIN